MVLLNKSITQGSQYDQSTPRPPQCANRLHGYYSHNSLHLCTTPSHPVLLLFYEEYWTSHASLMAEKIMHELFERWSTIRTISLWHFSLPHCKEPKILHCGHINRPGPNICADSAKIPTGNNHKNLDFTFYNLYSFTSQATAILLDIPRHTLVPTKLRTRQISDVYWTRKTLGQLRSGYYSWLNSYLSIIMPDILSIYTYIHMSFIQRVPTWH